MALSESSLTSKICANLTANGFVIDNEHSRQREFVAAIAKAVVDEIQANAQVPVSGGSSAGTYKVE